MGKLFPRALLSALCVFPQMAISGGHTGQDAFETGNDAFRNGDHASAISSYETAIANGVETSRLRYNMGLAYIRLGDYPRARESLLVAARDDDLKALADYQLGVIANAQGDAAAANEYFRSALAGAETARLKQLSLQALESLNGSAWYFGAAVSAGLAYDSNAFRSPDDPYIDFAEDPAVVVTPDEQSGSYIPLRIGFDAVRPLSGTSTFTAAYRHRGDYYSKSSLDNADETDHRLRFGVDRALGDGNSSSRQFSYGVFVRSHAETNYDRDDGLDRFDDGVSITDRFDYTAYGGEVEYRNRIGRVRYELEAGVQERDYDDLPTTAAYDYSAFRLGGAVKVPLASGTRLEAGYRYYDRSFDERRSRDASGISSSANPTLDYTYHQYELGVRHRVSSTFVTELVYTRTNRDDEFVGYNDYEKDNISWRSLIELSERLIIDVEIEYYEQDYPNAFAFNNPTQAAKEYDELQLEVGARYRLTDSLSVRADIKQEDVDSSDARGEYDRLRGGLSIYWEL